jgi:signal recognition particle GTPase
VQQVNQLLEARKQMEKLMKQMGKGKLPDLAAMQNGEAMASQRPRPSATKKRASKRKKKKARR